MTDKLAADECEICGNRPDADGCLEHGKGCYVVSEDGGGCEYFETSSPDDKLAAAENQLAREQAAEIERLRDVLNAAYVPLDDAMQMPADFFHVGDVLEADDVTNHEAKVRCAWLAWDVLRKALKPDAEMVSLRVQLATITADRDALQSKLDRAMSEYDRMNEALNRDPSGQDWLAMRDCLREVTADRDRLLAEVERARPVMEAAKALCAQPVLRNGDNATWGDVAQSHAEGPRLLARLMRAIDSALATSAQDGGKGEGR